jgi:FMN phosphatase YigB (HAD superfamily)
MVQPLLQAASNSGASGVGYGVGRDPAPDGPQEQVVYLGNDMYHDIFGAQQAGMHTVFFSTQHGNKEYKSVEADYVIHNFSGLPDAIAHLSKR